MPEWGRRVDVGGGIALGILSWDVSAWIPAFAGMTNGGRRWRTRKPFKRIFVRMTPVFIAMTNGGPDLRRDSANDE